MGKQTTFNSKRLCEKFAHDFAWNGATDTTSELIEKLLSYLVSAGGTAATTTVIGAFITGLGPGLALCGPPLFFLVLVLFKTMRDVRSGKKSPADLANALRELQGQLRAIHDRQVSKEEMERLFGQLLDERMGRMESLIQSRPAGAAASDDVTALVRAAFDELGIDQSLDHVRIYLSNISAWVGDLVKGQAQIIATQSEHTDALGRVGADTAEIRDMLVAFIRASTPGQQTQDPSLNRDLADAAALVARVARSGYADAAKAVADLSPSEATDYLVRRRRDLMESRRKLDARLDEEQDQYDRAVAAATFVEGRIAESLEAIQSLLSRHPNDLDALNRLGRVHRLQGRLKDAEAAYRRVLDLAADPSWKASALGNMGSVALTRGHLDEAMRLYGEALQLYRTLGSLVGEATSLGNMGIVAQTRGEIDEAMRLYGEALQLNKTLGDLEGQASALGNMGVVAQIRGDLDEAMRLYGESLKIEKTLGRLEGEATALGNMGSVARTRGDLYEAMRLYGEALQLNKALGSLEGQATNLTNMGIVAEIRGDLEEARRLWTESRDHYTRLGAKHEAAKVQSWLDSLPPPPP